MKDNNKPTAREATFMLNFEHLNFLPLARLLMQSSREDSVSSVALEAVFIKKATDTMDDVKITAKLLLSLEEKGFIRLDYDMPLSNYDYKVFEDSEVFALLKKTVDEGKSHPKFLFDTAYLEKGSISLTKKGKRIVELIGDV